VKNHDFQCILCSFHNRLIFSHLPRTSYCWLFFQAK